jgi:hypothetical protein
MLTACGQRVGEHASGSCSGSRVTLSPDVTGQNMPLTGGSMFNLLVNAMSAWNQAGLLLGAALFAGLGALLLGHQLHWRLRALRVTGTIIGVRSSDRGTYFPVYRYCLPDGTSAEATSDTGSSATAGMVTGTAVRLMVFPNHPDTACATSGYTAEIIGAIFLAAGVGLMYVALTVWPVTLLTWLMVLGILAFGATKFRRIFPPADQRPAVPAWRNSQAQQLRASVVRPIEEIASSADVSQQRLKQQKTSRLLTPIATIAGIALLVLAVHLGRNVYQLQTAGQRAIGTVVRLEIQSSSDGSSYYPIVRFVTERGASREFRDNTGSNPPSYRAGDAVKVLYLDSSGTTGPIIDRGMWNWLAPVAVLLFGTVLIAVGLRAARSTGNTPVLSSPLGPR